MFREYKNESYDEVIKKIVFIAKNVEDKPELSKETVKERIKKGHFVIEEEGRKRLGL